MHVLTKQMNETLKKLKKKFLFIKGYNYSIRPTPSHVGLYPSTKFSLFMACLASLQGLNPGKAIAEIKKMMATYKEKKAAAS